MLLIVTKMAAVARESIFRPPSRQGEDYGLMVQLSKTPEGASLFRYESIYAIFCPISLIWTPNSGTLRQTFDHLISFAVSWVHLNIQKNKNKNKETKLQNKPIISFIAPMLWKYSPLSGQQWRINKKLASLAKTELPKQNLVRSYNWRIWQQSCTSWRR